MGCPFEPMGHNALTALHSETGTREEKEPPKILMLYSVLMFRDSEHFHLYILGIHTYTYIVCSNVTLDELEEP
jgi:hypothetical protein